MNANFIRMALASPPYPPPPLSRVSSLDALRRHLVLAIDYGTNPMAAEYLAEIKRREAVNQKEAA